MAGNLADPYVPFGLADAGIDPDTLGDPAASAETLCIAGERATAVRVAVSGMTPEHGALLALRYGEGLTITAAATRLGVSRVSASRMERRALARLAISLELMGME